MTTEENGDLQGNNMYAYSELSYTEFIKIGIMHTFLKVPLNTMGLLRNMHRIPLLFPDKYIGLHPKNSKIFLMNLFFIRLGLLDFYISFLHFLCLHFS